MPPKGNTAKFLRSRHWTLTKQGWTKRGWYLPPLQARAVEEYFERSDGAVPWRSHLTTDELRVVYAAMGAVKGDQ